MHNGCPVCVVYTHTNGPHGSRTTFVMAQQVVTKREKIGLLNGRSLSLNVYVERGGIELDAWSRGKTA
jgi:hypothetical protein